MPTENRSSNTEMVSVPRRLLETIRGFHWTQQDSTDLARAKARAELIDALAQPAPQPHPEPIAWMVGTAFWWTKEEAERDAAATGLPIVGLGPMSGIEPAEQHQGEPVQLPAYKLASEYNSHDWDEGFRDGWGACRDEIGKLGPLYTHADPGEVERLRQRVGLLEKYEAECLALVRDAEAERDTLRAQLAESDALLHEIRGQSGSSWLRGETQHKLDAALSTSAEPSAPPVQPGKCLDGGDCGIGGICKWCPHTAASPAQQPS